MHITTSKSIGNEYLARAMSYSAYRQMIDELLAAGKSTGPEQSEELVEYSRLNAHRMRRIEKTIELLPGVRKAAEGVAQAQTWLVLAEGWCGDGAQILPVMDAIAKTNPLISLKILLRDENPGLMDQYLTNGKRSIPKLVAVDTVSGEEIFTWGPKPQALQQLTAEWKSSGMPMAEVKEKTHGWYAKDKTASTQLELKALL